MNTKLETKPTTTEAIETIQTVDLDDVTGGCAACGCGNPGTPTANRSAVAPFQFSGFNRR